MPLADLFSPVAFFITLRETLEAGIIIAVLLGFISQILPPTSPSSPYGQPFVEPPASRPSGDSQRSSTELLSSPDTRRPYGTSPPTQTSQLAQLGIDLGDETQKERMRRKMKWQVWSGAVLGGLAASVVGAVFLWVFYTYTHDLWQDAENLWEGGFCLLASVLILLMALAFLRLPHSHVKWRLKLLSAYSARSSEGDGRAEGKGGRMILFGLPFITVLREGMEGVVFLGGIGLSETPRAIFGGAAGGIIAGTIIAYLLFTTTSPLRLSRFTTFSTLLLLLIGSGLFSRAAYSLERQYFIAGVGTAAAEAGTGPGSYRVAGNIWKLTWGNPEPGAEDGSGWAQLSQSLVGWNNIGTLWTVTSYQGYWLVVIFTLVYMKWKEGRTEVFGRRSKRGRERLARRKTAGGGGEEEVGLLREEAVEVSRS